MNKLYSYHVSCLIIENDYFCSLKNRFIMIVTKDRVVSLTYQLRIDKHDGEIVESLSKDSPLIFLYGSGNLLPKFEENIDGLKVGDKFNFNLNADDAYGSLNEGAIVDVPISAFSMNGTIDNSMLQIGNKIPMQDSSGNKLTGVVSEVTEDSVKMDFNHPLAGNHLFFDGEITDIRNATEEEMHHGHPHYEGSCEGCESCGGHEGGGGHCC
jgi:FKBP-type peptidyl-prolyl cis-trans isomerase SlyD